MSEIQDSAAIIAADMRQLADDIEAGRAIVGQSVWRSYANRVEAIGTGNIAKLRNALELSKVAILVAKKKMNLENPVILEIIDDALAAPPRECDKYENHLEEDGLLAAFKKHCDECDCPMGCIHRRLPTRGDSRDLPILGCFARFALSKVSKESEVAK